MRMIRVVSVCCFLLTVAGCQNGPGGWWPAEGNGPQVVFDLNRKPLPEIPFPNDLATRPDASSPTGRRINASLVAPTWLESFTRSQIDRLDGFGLLQSITVAFDAPLDLDDILRRHRDNLDFSDDAVFLLVMDEGSPDFAKPVLLDLGRGNFPLTLNHYDVYFPADPRATATNAIFETVAEDLNGNGLLDPGEDSDDDGVLDRPNVWPPETPAEDGLLTFYELETNTLILRPVAPLRENTTYAVLLTRRLRGHDGQSVRSPFGWNHHLAQREALAPLERALARHPDWNLRPQDIAFAWTFTTQAASTELLAIREGLYGRGPLGWLAGRFLDDARPEEVVNAEHAESRPPYTVLPAERLVKIVELLGPQLLGPDFQVVEPVLNTFEHVDYLVAGSFESPDFLATSADGLDLENPHREVFDLDLSRGRARVEGRRLHFLAAVPKVTEHHRPPFPVVIYCHSYSSLRVEALGFAGFMARHGLATVGIDAWGHGLPLDPEMSQLLDDLARSFGLEPFVQSIKEGRARDVTGDGQPDSGADYWTAYGTHTRDAVRQSIADHLQLVRVMKGFDGQRTWNNDANGDGQRDLAGDFNGDGVVDFGGPDAAMFAWGQSGGAINSSILGPLEPNILATAPVAGGGGLADIGVRTMLGGVRRATMLVTMGPLVVGLPQGDGRTTVSLVVARFTEERHLPLGIVEGLTPGDWVKVENRQTGDVRLVRVRPGGMFRASIAADRGQKLRVSFYRPDGRQPYLVLERFPEDVYYLDTRERGGQPDFRAGDEIRTPAEGFGLERCRPDLRRMLGLFQMILEPADPATYARYYGQPLYLVDGAPAYTGMLEVACAGDQDVPVNTQVALGRAAGLIGFMPGEEQARLDGLTPNDWLVRHYVVEGLARLDRFPGSGAVFDPDDLDQGRDGFLAPQPSLQQRLRLTVDTPVGQSGIRFAYMLPQGQHGVFPVSRQPAFDMFSFIINQIGWYFASGGKRLSDDLCLEDGSCAPCEYPPPRR